MNRSQLYLNTEKQGDLLNNSTKLLVFIPSLPSPQAGLPYLAFVFVLGDINPSFSKSSPAATIANPSLLCVCWHFLAFPQREEERKSGNDSHVLPESIRSAEMLSV